MLTSITSCVVSDPETALAMEQFHFTNGDFLLEESEMSDSCVSICPSIVFKMFVLRRHYGNTNSAVKNLLSC